MILFSVQKLIHWTASRHVNNIQRLIQQGYVTVKRSTPRFLEDAIFHAVTGPRDPFVTFPFLPSSRPDCLPFTAHQITERSARVSNAL